MQDEFFKLGGHNFSSRLIVGTGKFNSKEIMVKAIEATKTQMVTVALRRVDFRNPKDNLLSYIDRKKYIILPNTSGAQTADEAIRIAMIAREAGVSDWIKIEVTPDPRYLLPDGEETLKAAQVLAKEGFKVMPYINADPILAKKLEDAGCVSVMPLGSPIGSNRGLKTLELIKIIIEQSNIPVIVDAGIGKPSDASEAMELGASAVLINTAIATAEDPVLIAEAFHLAVLAGRKGFLSGLPIEKQKAEASSPLDWVSKL
ncbi:MAG: thiazole synthase [Spirochaetes bacterium GWD1_27_9]|nr:MAG: thiazole synthase [Spirochaetes bacterium GWB1_27_13]OHD22480.1 MAG: thiazole synthase [Spirochaetes bacterium GWC1_27_15]OHD42821.1 MAG: thiazole synthase [Spirochaetes bacterium GWD1_27_9]